MRFLLIVLLSELVLMSQVLGDDYVDLFATDPSVGRMSLPTTTRATLETSKLTTTLATIRTRATQRTPVDVHPKANRDDTWDDEKCDESHKCVPYFLCKDGKINTDGSLLINPRLDIVASTSEVSCPKLEKCCKRSDYESSSDTFCSGRFPTPVKCGRRNERGIGGTVETVETTAADLDSQVYAKYAEFPWMMAVLSAQIAGNVAFNVFTSGGSLIHPKVVLTAAHNIQNLTLSKIVVRGGEWDTQTVNEMCKHEERFAAKIIVHESFDDTTYQNDIALIILKEEFKMSPFINTVCLPPKGTSFDEKQCISGGWGKSKFGKDERYQVFLKRIDLKVVESTLCQEKMRKTLLGKDFILHEKFLCAGGEENVDTCTGDGGSPLVCSIDGSPRDYYQAGVVIAGIGCGRKNIPGLYADVSKYREWIDGKMNDLGFGSATYTH